MGGIGGPQAKLYTVFLWYVLEICGGLEGKGIINRKIKKKKDSGKKTFF